jgi:hypothetical protein
MKGNPQILVFHEIPHKTVDSLGFSYLPVSQCFLLRWGASISWKAQRCDVILAVPKVLGWVETHWSDLLDLPAWFLNCVFFVRSVIGFCLCVLSPLCESSFWFWVPEHGLRWGPNFASLRWYRYRFHPFCVCERLCECIIRALMTYIVYCFCFC